MMINQCNFAGYKGYVPKKRSRSTWTCNRWALSLKHVFAILTLFVFIANSADNTRSAAEPQDRSTHPDTVFHLPGATEPNEQQIADLRTTFTLTMRKKKDTSKSYEMRKVSVKLCETNGYYFKFKKFEWFFKGTEGKPTSAWQLNTGHLLGPDGTQKQNAKEIVVKMSKRKNKSEQKSGARDRWLLLDHEGKRFLRFCTRVACESNLRTVESLAGHLVENPAENTFYCPDRGVVTTADALAWFRNQGKKHSTDLKTFNGEVYAEFGAYLKTFQEFTKSINAYEEYQKKFIREVAMANSEVLHLSHHFPQVKMMKARGSTRHSKLLGCFSRSYTVYSIMVKPSQTKSRGINKKYYFRMNTDALNFEWKLHNIKPASDCSRTGLKRVKIIMKRRRGVKSFFKGGAKNRYLLLDNEGLGFLRYCAINNFPISDAVKKENHCNFLNQSCIKKAVELESNFCKKTDKLRKALLKGDDKKYYEEHFPKDVTPFKREWKGDSRTENTIRVCQFNILGHGLSGKGSGFATLYKYGCPDKIKPAVENNYLHGEDYRELLYSKTWGDHSAEKPYDVPERLNRVLGLLLKQAPDVITLQELDHYNHFSKVLGEIGYEGRIHYKKNLPDKKTGIIKETPAQKNNGHNGYDGVAIFWNTQRFDFVTQTKVLLHKPDKNGVKGGQSKQRVLRVVLRNRATKKEFVVITGHLKSGDKKKDEPDQKNHVKEVLAMLKENDNEGRPIIFALDFNKNDNTEIFKDFWKVAEKEIGMKSAYKLNNENAKSCVKWRKGGEQEDKLKKTRETIDFIFTKGFTKKAVLELPTVDEVNTATGNLGLPCWKYPSDHFMIAADLELGETQEIRVTAQTVANNEKVSESPWNPVVDKLWRDNKKDAEKNTFYSRPRLTSSVFVDPTTPAAPASRNNGKRRLVSLEPLLELCRENGYVQ